MSPTSRLWPGSRFCSFEPWIHGSRRNRVKNQLSEIWRTGLEGVKNPEGKTYGEALLRIFIPARSFWIESPLGTGEWVERLSAVVRPTRSLSERVFRKRGKPYEGRFDGAGFRVRRV